EDGFWLGTDVMVFNAGPDNDFTWEPEVYKNKKIPIEESPDDFVNAQWDPRLMSYRQLSKYIRILRFSTPVAVRRLLVELNYKLAFPFTAMVTVLVGIPFSISSGRANVLIGMVRGIAAAMLYLPVTAISVALGKGGVLPPVLAAWLGNILFALWGVHLVNKRS
ncbi:MAG: LptF/LptG family permease, partial [Candidatus Omnitrophica bacterium]|nr:LptF/LptG family permease [Candidatus Omnitrophota bacterium]